MESIDEIEQRAMNLREHAVSGKADREKYAWQALSEMSPDESVTTVLCWLKQDTKVFQRMPATSVALLILALLLYPLAKWAKVDAPTGNLIAVAMTTWMATYAMAGQLRRKSYKFLASCNDVRVVDTLIRASDTKPDQNRSVFVSALTRLLPSLRFADAALLSPRSRAILNENLLHTTDVVFVLSILSALKEVGDLAAIPYVERLANGQGKVGDVRSIREAALDAIPAIRNAAERSSASDRLLRPSELDERTSALLRPASTGITGEQALLKPSSNESV